MFFKSRSIHCSSFRPQERQRLRGCRHLVFWIIAFFVCWNLHLVRAWKTKFVGCCNGNYFKGFELWLHWHVTRGFSWWRWNNSSKVSFDIWVQCVWFGGEFQVPASWRSLIEEPATLRLYMDIFLASAQTQQTEAMSLVSIKHILFPFWVIFLSFSVDAMPRTVSLCPEVSFFKWWKTCAVPYWPDFDHGRSDQTPSTLCIFFEFCFWISFCVTVLLQDSSHDSYLHFCRLLSRLKANYQLTELVKLDLYPEWINAVATFTDSSFGNYVVQSNTKELCCALPFRCSGWKMVFITFLDFGRGWPYQFLLWKAIRPPIFKVSYQR